jgi:ketosteroid isomerase-like protein
MSQDDVELVISAFAEAIQNGQVQMGAMIEDDEIWRRNRERFSPDVEVRFATPGTGGVSVMEQEFEGIEGLRDGWREWMKPWEQFRVELEETIDAGEGRVLVLGRATGRMRGAGAELPQEVAALCQVEEGRIVAVGFYLDQAQARRDAGLA